MSSMDVLQHRVGQRECWDKNPIPDHRPELIKLLVQCITVSVCVSVEPHIYNITTLSI